jgi:16S rRNA (guanine527-N7)-methyltransferase
MQALDLSKRFLPYRAREAASQIFGQLSFLLCLRENIYHIVLGDAIEIMTPSKGYRPVAQRGYFGNRPFDHLSIATACVFCYSLNMDQDINLLQQRARRLDIELTDQQLTQFDMYRQELLKWNASTNLISENSSREIITRHFLDSLAALKFITPLDARMLDLGSGAGLPGIPLKIACPGLQLYLVETNRRKVSFLKNVLRLLALPEVFVLHERAEILQKNSEWKDYFDIIISRAAFKLPAMLPLGAFFLMPGGRLLALKSCSITSEFSAATAVAGRYGFSELFQHDIDEKFLDIPRKIIVGEKTK